MTKLKEHLSHLRRPITNRFVKPKMTNEARKYLDNFSNKLNASLNSCTELLQSNLQKPMKEFLQQVSPTIDKIAVGQKEELMYLPFHTMLYLITKKLQPEISVETGVQIGGSTYSILRGMEENNKGKLYSIDIGRFFAHNGKFVSLIAPLVTEPQKPFWKFVCGNAEKVLSNVITPLSKLDFFCAGHSHTYKVQKFEGELAWPHIRKGGVFVLDRADNNDNRYLNEFLDKYSNEVDFHRTYKEGRSSAGLEFTVILKK